MPLMMCPNDNSPMQAIDRAGVQFDMCPTCRGVWLDRGELEKLMAAAASEAAPPPGAGHAHAPHPYAPPPPRPQAYRPRDDDDYGDQRGYPRRKKKGFDLFDIFD